MITISGRTFEHRPLMRAIGARWDDKRKVWIADHISDEHYNIVKNTVGLIISGPRKPDVPWYQRNPTPEKPKLGPPIRIGDDFTYLGYFKDQEPHIYQGFSSLAKFVDYVDGLERPDNRGGTCDVGWTAEPEYAGTRNMTEAIELARNGWLDGLGVGDRLLPPEPMAKRRKRSVAGGKVNVGRLLAGAPDHMTRRVKLQGRKIATIFVETCMWEGIGINTALTRVVAIAAIIDRMEQQGYSCNIVATYCSKTTTGLAGQTVVTIKQAGERLNIGDISFAFGHPSYGRRLVYAANGAIPDYSMKHSWRGRISEAFDKYHKPGVNEYYIDKTWRNDTDVWSMLRELAPDNLPIEIKEPR